MVPEHDKTATTVDAAAVRQLIPVTVDAYDVPGVSGKVSGEFEGIRRL